MAEHRDGVHKYKTCFQASRHYIPWYRVVNNYYTFISEITIYLREQSVSKRILPITVESTF
jgi:hypothetical protein